MNEIINGYLRPYISRPGQPLSPEQWAEIITNKLISVADTTPQPLRDQAHAARDEMFKTLVYYISEIRKEQEAYFLRK